MLILHVVGARPNFMKAAAVITAFEENDDTLQKIIHTGQHYDFNMSDVFWQQLALPEQINLGVGIGSHARQTARIMLEFEKTILEYKPDIIFVYGDVNSTMAAALVAAKLAIPVAHVEAGLRSYDRSMPEEINRLVTDQVSDLHFTPCEGSLQNLLREGISKENIHFVGNVMIDTLIKFLPKIEKAPILQNLGLQSGQYLLLTLHRPSNVDDQMYLLKILNTISRFQHKIRIVFPVHPRTRNSIEKKYWQEIGSKIIITEPLGYFDFLALQKNALAVITDSGGIQEETTYLQIPCLTMRENTERPITIDVGTNILLGKDCTKLKQEIEKILNGKIKMGSIPKLWDGQAGRRITQITKNFLDTRIPK